MRKRSNPSVVILLLIVIVIAAVVAHRTKQAAVRLPSGAAATAIDRTELRVSNARLGPPDIYPDPIRTPGAIDPEITQNNIQENICNPDWSTKSIRPPVHYTNELKREQMQEYGDEDTNPRDYEEDHLIPLELGGNPTDPRNLWPEPYITSVADGGARSKDRVESYLHRQVCSGSITLDEAQQEIASDWYRVYVASVRRN